MMKTRAILVTGSRDFTDKALLEHALRDVCAGASPRTSVLIHGDARGADAMAAEYASNNWGVRPVAMPAPWRELGRAAGSARNTQMISVLRALQFCGYECHVLAFPMPDSVGTWDCVRKARGAGFEVTVYGQGEDGLRPR